MSYAELLRDPRWQRKRLEILERADFSCERCEEREKPLHVHHRRYAKSGKPWDVEASDLEALCETCHQRATALNAELKAAVAVLDEWDLEQLVGYAQGLAVRAAPALSKVTVRNAEHADGVAAAWGLNTESLIEALPAGGVVSGVTLDRWRTMQREWLAETFDLAAEARKR